MLGLRYCLRYGSYCAVVVVVVAVVVNVLLKVCALPRRATFNPLLLFQPLSVETLLFAMDLDLFHRCRVFRSLMQPSKEPR